MYRVLRHGGNSNHKWRVVLETESEEEALKCYEKERFNLRQGQILLKKDDEVILSNWAPRIRVRW